jgi:hypothetical protein
MTDEIKYLDLLGKEWEEVGKCYGLVRILYARRGIDLPVVEDPGDAEERNALFLMGLADHCEPITRPEPWALVTASIGRSEFVTHIGAVLPGGRRFIHAQRSRRVTTDALNKVPWGRIRGIYRWIG